MMELIFRLTFFLTGLTALLISIMIVLPFDDPSLQGFVTNPDICDGQCLFGIRPRTTTVSEAMAMLIAHHSVTNIQLSAPGNGYGQIRWDWSGTQPEWIDTEYRGRITFYWDDEEPTSPTLEDTIIETISIYTSIRMYSLQSWYGEPDSGVATIRPDTALGYAASYHKRGNTLSFSTVIPCPVGLMSYWNARTRISLSIGVSIGDFVPIIDMVDLC